MINAPLTLAILPGFPKPETEGPHYEANKAYVRARGLPSPVLVDRDGVAWAGRTFANICWELGIDIATNVVEDGTAAAIQELATRDLTVVPDRISSISQEIAWRFPRSRPSGSLVMQRVHNG